MNNLISIVIPIYNEEKVIEACLSSLAKQSYRLLEIILVDDGSRDKTQNIINQFKKNHPKIDIKVYSQNHKGPGCARNLGATKASGSILVFVDSDMIFDKDFICDLTKPIIKGRTIGTFSKNEMNANKDNIWSACWNINRGWPLDRLIPPDYPDQAPVYRAILKKEFDRVGGFDASGDYTDDWSLSRKLKQKSTVAPIAIYYHNNPSSLSEIWKQARWIGKNEFISGNLPRKLRSLIKYSLPSSVVIGIYKSIASGKSQFLIFKLIYDLAIQVSVIKSFFNEAKSK